jgi:hypothetical protein
MRKRTKIIVGGLTVAIALAAVVSTAAARRIELSEQRFLILFVELTFEAGNFTFICPINLEGSFHSRVFSKISGQLVGSVTEATAHACSGSSFIWMLNGVERTPQGATTPNTLPWQVSFIGFNGVLPRIREIELSVTNGSFGLEFDGLCLYKATSREWIGLEVHLEEGRAVRVRWSETRRIPLLEGIFLCPSSIIFKGEGTIGTQSTWREITVRLVQ